VSEGRGRRAKFWVVRVLTKENYVFIVTREKIEGKGKNNVSGEISGYNDWELSMCLTLLICIEKKGKLHEIHMFMEFRSGSLGGQALLHGLKIVMFRAY
jgi:hypothetical protein